MSTYACWSGGCEVQVDRAGQALAPSVAAFALLGAKVTRRPAVRAYARAMSKTAPLIVLGLVLALLAGCGSSASRADFDADAATQKCIDGVRAAFAASPAERQSRLAAAVSATFSDKACREAHAHVAFVAPGDRTAALAAAHETCARRYCTVLPEPRPTACKNLDSVDTTAMAQLYQAIKLHDLGPERLARLQRELAAAIPPDKDREP